MSELKKATVVIKSFNRPTCLQNLLNDLERDGKRLKTLDVRVFDDGSTEDMETCFQFCREKGWSVERFGFNHGKKKAWVLHNKIMADLRNVPADHLLVFLDDDMRLCKDFFVRLGFYWSEAVKFDAISLQLMIDSSRVDQPCWTSYIPTQLNEHVRKIQWVDGSYACTTKLLKMLHWILEPILESRWIKNPSLSTGVGQQISRRLYSLNKLMLQPSESLIVHVDVISFYNLEERKRQPLRAINFVDGEESCNILEQSGNPTSFSTNKMTERDRPIYASLASIPARVDTLKGVVETILPQVDKMYVYLNGYNFVPEFLRRSQVEYILDITNKLGDRGKVYWADKLEGYCFLCDDDIKYPADYVEKMLKYYHSEGRSCVVGVHGVIVKSPLVGSYYRDRLVYNFGESLKEKMYCNVLGTGCLMYNSDDIKITNDSFRRRNMADIWFALLAQQQEIPMICVPRKERWLSQAYLGRSIFNDMKDDDAYQTKLVNSTSWRIFK